MPAGGLHQRLDDDGADRVALRRSSSGAQLGEDLGGAVGARSARARSTPGEPTLRVSSRIGR